MAQSTPSTPPAAPGSSLYGLLYTSRAVRPLAREEIAQLLRHARIRNAACSITGVLLHRDGHFMQYLEGPAAAVRRTYELIRLDRRHRDVVEQQSGPIAQREFASWTMGYSCGPSTAAVDPLPDRLLLARHLADSQAQGSLREALRQFRAGLQPA